MTPLPSDDSIMGRILTACKPEGRLCIAEVDGKLYLRAYGFMAYWKASYFKDQLLSTPGEDALREYRREADRIIEQERGFVAKLGKFYHKKGKQL